MRLVDQVPEVTFKTRVLDDFIEGPNPVRWENKTSRDLFAARNVAAGVETVMLIPQSPAYASILPLVAYVVLGSSRALMNCVSKVENTKTGPARERLKMIFRQLYDNASSTFTYLLADESTKEAILIDPVFENARRDLALIEELSLKHCCPGTW